MIRIVLAAIVILSASHTAAETAYVTDILQLGLHAAEDTSDRPFRSLQSGTELEVLTRVPNYALVETANGEQGWVKSAYLVDQKPARLRVTEVEAALEIMRDELESAQLARQEAEQEATRLGLNIEARANSSEAVLDTLERLKSETEVYEQRLETYRGSIPLAWVVAALALALVGGFFAGMWALDAMIRRRHGGFRVY
ncbi:MAG: TIGR04211 family SH3 domain-containing protein [Gammaproteobacteria bacterium]